jgi:hypothetical protein
VEANNGKLRRFHIIFASWKVSDLAPFPSTLHQIMKKGEQDGKILALQRERNY